MNGHCLKTYLKVPKVHTTEPVIEHVVFIHKALIVRFHALGSFVSTYFGLHTLMHDALILHLLFIISQEKTQKKTLI